MHLPYTVQCRSIDVTVNHCKSESIYSNVLGATIKCKQYSCGKCGKSVQITLNIFAVYCMMKNATFFSSTSKLYIPSTKNIHDIVNEEKDKSKLNKTM
jgi:transcription elongation factor Elf1